MNLTSVDMSKMSGRKNKPDFTSLMRQINESKESSFPSISLAPSKEVSPGMQLSLDINATSDGLHQETGFTSKLPSFGGISGYATRHPSLEEFDGYLEFILGLGEGTVVVNLLDVGGYAFGSRLKYHPLSKDAEHGRFTVSTSGDKTTVACGGKSVTVKYIHFNEWPDKSIPASNPFHDFLEKLITELESAKTLVVNCKMGIGRTICLFTALHIHYKTFEASDRMTLLRKVLDEIVKYRTVHLTVDQIGFLSELK